MRVSVYACMIASQSRDLTASFPPRMNIHFFSFSVREASHTYIHSVYALSVVTLNDLARALFGFTALPVSFAPHEIRSMR